MRVTQFTHTSTRAAICDMVRMQGTRTRNTREEDPRLDDYPEASSRFMSSSQGSHSPHLRRPATRAIPHEHRPAMRTVSVFVIPVRAPASIVPLEEDRLECEHFGSILDMQIAHIATYQLSVYRPGGCSDTVHFLVWRVWPADVVEVNHWARALIGNPAVNGALVVARVNNDAEFISVEEDDIPAIRRAVQKLVVHHL
ncbi:hypothetical protein OH77DRAFT_299991 [Trametes cingulata]|nr:hypothetical protein OH77DRAFT_299991 [Trametes cingulata]